MDLLKLAWKYKNIKASFFWCIKEKNRFRPQEEREKGNRIWAATKQLDISTPNIATAQFCNLLMRASQLYRKT